MKTKNFFANFFRCSRIFFVFQIRRYEIRASQKIRIVNKGFFVIAIISSVPRRSLGTNNWLRPGRGPELPCPDISFVDYIGAAH